MALRNIIKIDEDKCNGCGLCAKACAEGAIKIINGKAKLVSEIYCDGLGACIGRCPQNAITIEQRQAADFDEEATKKHLQEKETVKQSLNFVCPGTAMRNLKPADQNAATVYDENFSQLGQWPVQLKLVSPNAPYFKNADLLLVADCVPFAVGNFHNRFLKNRSIAIGCPKLDDCDFYIEKFAAILKANKLNSLSVIHMEVPCCSGLTRIAQKAIELAQIQLPFKDITIALDGSTANETYIV